MQGAAYRLEALQKPKEFRLMRHLLVPLALLAVAACSRDSQPQQDRELLQIPALEVTAVDQFGPLTGMVKGIAMWSHPTLPFNSLVIAAGEAGLVAWNVEDGAEVARDDRTPLDGVSVAYLGNGTQAQGYAVARTTGSEARYFFYAIDNVSREFNLLSMTSVGERRDGRGFCLGGSGDSLVLHEMTQIGWRSTNIAINTGGLAFSEAVTAGKSKGGFSHCAVDGLNGAIIAVNALGEVYRIESTSPSLLVSTGISDPAGIGLALNGPADGTPNDQCCGQIAVLDGVNAIVRLYDREDGHALGAVRMAASFDVEAVVSASALGVGYGNFGAVYRDGLVALATEEGDSAIRLTPFNGIMDALAQPLGEAANPRDLSPQEEEGFVIDVEVVKP
ncbi:MAG: hypothetical protein RIE56_06900 [Amphiplicatus sp.]